MHDLQLLLGRRPVHPGEIGRLHLGEVRELGEQLTDGVDVQAPGVLDVHLHRTDQGVQRGSRLFARCWSGNNRVLGAQELHPLLAGDGSAGQVPLDETDTDKSSGTAGRRCQPARVQVVS